MIVVDTSIWIDHLRFGNAQLADRLARSVVLGHPAVLGEIALGQVKNRTVLLGLLRVLPPAVEATHAETVTLIETKRLYGSGIGYLDAQILASTVLTPSSTLWTRDKRLHAVAVDLGIDSPPMTSG